MVATIGLFMYGVYLEEAYLDVESHAAGVSLQTGTPFLLLLGIVLIALGAYFSGLDKKTPQ
jgi:hypothetical protein